MPLIQVLANLFREQDDSPTPRAYTRPVSGIGIADDAGAIVMVSSRKFRRPSLNKEDKISITPLADYSAFNEKLNSAGLSLQPLAKFVRKYKAFYPIPQKIRHIFFLYFFGHHPNRETENIAVWANFSNFVV